MRVNRVNAPQVYGQILKTYKELENNNDHSEAAFLLVNNFGTKEEVQTIRDIMERHEKLGHIVNSDRELRYQTSQKYYNALTKYLQSVNA